ncbi:MAG: anion permease [Gracilibacteraceae bacterium]|jgi:sodium-dependent dicarboxylate transporter 2/3/5|nr:anion permease [Gracilibacteraceae bacterium]
MTPQLSEKPVISVPYYINCAIVFLLVFCGQFIPASEPITPYGMKILGIFLGMLYGWSTVGIVWPSFLGLIALGFSEYMQGSVTAVFKEGYGGDTFLFIFFILAFANVIDSAGVSGFIAKWMVSRKISRGRPYVLMGVLLTTAYVVAALVSVTPAIVICWSILYQFCAVFGYTRNDQYPKIAVVGIVLAGMMGINIFPFKAFNIMMMGVLEKAGGATVNYIAFTVFAIAVGYLTTLLYVFLAKFVFKPDVTPITQSDFVYKNDEKLDARQKGVLALLAVMIVLMFLPGFLPATLPLVKFLKTVGNTGIVVVLLGLGALLQRNGKSFVNYAQAVKNGVPWETMALMGTAMPLAAALTQAETGVQAALNQLLGPIFNGQGALLLIVTITAFTIILTNIMNNVVVGFIAMPLIIQFSPAAGLDPAMLTVLICVVCQIAIVLPSASPLAAFLHGNREWVSANDIFRYSIPLALASIVLNIIVCMTIGRIIF